MKEEQDAAHSKEFKYKRMETLHKINMQQLAELTRLRSELQQAKQEKESMKRIVEELLRAIKFGEAELRITYERYTNYKGSSSLWLMQEILVKYKK